MTVADYPLQPARRIQVVEAARGLCALYVVVAHVFQILGYKYSLLSDIPLIVDLATGYPHQAVLFFFLLSGFSIHYSSVGRPLDNAAGVARYMYLRLRRVYPIFLLVVLGVFVLYLSGVAFDVAYYQRVLDSLLVKDVLLTVFFLADREMACGRFATVIPTNPPLWSLSYEILYYLVYPVFWRASQHFSIFFAVACGCLISAVAAIVGMLHCGHFLNVLSLYFVWCLGALLAEYKRRGVLLPLPRSVVYLVPLFSVLSVWVIAKSRYANLDTLFWVPAFFVVMAFPVSSGSFSRLNKQESIFCLLAIFVLASMVVALTGFKVLSDDMPTFYIRLEVFSIIWVFLVLSDGQLWRENFSSWLISRFHWIGSISYGLYLIHYPFLVWAREFSRYWLWPIHSALLVLPLILYLAWVIEIRYQSWFANKLDRWLVSSGARL